MVILMITHDSMRNSTLQTYKWSMNPNYMPVIGTLNVIKSSLSDVGSQPLKIVLQLCKDVIHLSVRCCNNYRILVSSIVLSHPGWLG